MSGEHTSGLTFLSITPWVGKGILATVLIPLLFYWMFRIALQEKTGQTGGLLGITGLAGCLLSSMGIMLTPVFVGLTILVLSLTEEKYFLSGAWNRGLYSLYYFRSLLYLSDPLMLTEKNFERI